MYAIIESGGGQHRVAEGDIIRVERLPDGSGNAVSIDKVLMIAKDGETLVGKPYVENATVEAVVAEDGLDEKVIVFKKKRRTKYRRLNGHRQQYTELQIKKINC